MDGLEHGIPLADIGASGGAHSALELRGLIGEDVPVQVGQDDHLEVAPPFLVHQLCRHYIHEPVIELNFRILAGYSPGYLQELAVCGLDHIGLGDRRDSIDTILFGILECQAHDSLRSLAGDNLEVHCQVLSDIES